MFFPFYLAFIIIYLARRFDLFLLLTQISLSFPFRTHDQVTANMHHYLNSTLGEVQEFDYDINLLLHAASICVGYAFVLPLLLWTTTYCCMSITSLQLVEWVCLYGYSLVPYLPAVVLSIIPFGLVSWILLAVATGVSVLLVVRNVAHPMLSSDVGQAKAPPILLVILGSGVIFLLFLKFTFYHYTPSS